MTNDKPIKIAVIGGDGTGPEVAAEGLKVLAAAAKLEGFRYELTHFDFGGARYLKTGEVLPSGAVDELRAFDAIYLGAIPGEAVPRRRDAAEGQGAKRHRFRGGPRKHRGLVLRRGGISEEGDRR
jgi:isocitrate/isopropylmalate dehydrogenase